MSKKLLRSRGDATESALDRFNTDFVMMVKTLDALFVTLTEQFISSE